MNSLPERPVLLCFCHLRWDFVFQRPQHLLSRAAGEWRVLFFEEPVFDQPLHAQLRRRMAAPNIEILTPHLPEGLGEAEIIEAQKTLLDQLLAEDPQSQKSCGITRPWRCRSAAYRLWFACL